MSLRAKQKNMTRSLLLEAGLRLFQENGYSATKIDDISAAVGANRTTFYLHFPSKVELMLALVEHINDEVVASDAPRLAQVIESGDRASIHAWITRRFDQWPVIMPYVSVAQQAAAMDREVAAAVEHWLETPVEEIRAGLDAASRFAPPSRRPRGILAFAQVEVMSRHWMTEGWGPRLDRSSALESMVDVWCLLLGTEDAAAK